MKKIPYPPKNDIENLYFIRKFNKKQISRFYGCNEKTLHRWFVFYEIPSRSQSDICKWKMPEKEFLINLYENEKMTTIQICQRLNISKGCLYNWMKHYGILADKTRGAKAMIGRIHSKEWNEAISKGHKGLKKPYNRGRKNHVFTTSISPKRSSKYTAKGGIRKDLGIYLRSSWEANVGRYLNFLKQNGEILDWEYEPETFHFSNPIGTIHSYTPDFRVYKHDNTHYWIEVKGQMFRNDQIKIDLFKKDFPDEQLFIYDLKWIMKNEPIFRHFIPTWEPRCIRK